MERNRRLKRQNYYLLLLVLIIPVVSLFLGGNSEFGGADGMVVELIDEADRYTPWFDNVWAPPGGETESLLFSLQAAIGAGVLFYFIGYIKGKRAAANDK
ncbi:energy-coupling factor ABC transporter substrate-binding protein [Carboxylicivirga sp. M1479]|uniref:energy-coupling factor ABC transporter substrate-binding protein n=1 Tax=Carboxylicivirga sp. M1479 TaxID=2594476 RepID=UPI001177DDA9|nr:energy-coupling factor ABC transporter substrate-binding protein [Carboxylicivirga sp. M1479]TRX70225.1 energy-coupling factor ABC transporter substrate-binding protein [Carboxylicivirga sp. M1479]